MAESGAPDSAKAERDEARAWLDCELSGLPEKYRLPIILHHLRNQTQEETARLLGENTGTVSARLNRGRELLKDRLARRGVVYSLGALAGLLSDSVSAVELAAGFAAHTARAAAHFSSGQAAAGGLLSLQAQTLAKGALKMLFVEKLKGAAALVALAACVAASPLVVSSFAAEPDAPAPAAPPPLVAAPAKPEAKAAKSVIGTLRSKSGSVTGKKAAEARDTLGDHGCFVVRSSARWEQLTKQMAELGWVADPKNENGAMGPVNFASHMIVCVFKYGENHTSSLTCQEAAGDADTTEIVFERKVTVIPANKSIEMTEKWNLAWIAVPVSKTVNVSVRTYSGSGAAEKSTVEWSANFDASKGDIVGGLAGTIQIEQKIRVAGDDILAEFKLAFANPSVKGGGFAPEFDAVHVWDGKYSNGYRNHAFLVETPDGRTLFLRPAVIDAWDKNAPHPVKIAPGQDYVLPNWGGTKGKSLKELGLKTDVPGVYKITGVYTETASDPFRRQAAKPIDMWGGDIATNTIEIEVKAK